MTHRDNQNSQNADLDRLDRMMDEPVVHERFGGMTMREMVRKAVLRRSDSVDDPISESKIIGSSIILVNGV